MALMKKTSALTFVVAAALVATCFLQLRANIDLPEQDGNHVVYNSSSESGGEACCDNCLCTKSMPPQCRCLDIKPYCHPSCKACLCNLSYPPQCQCFDVKEHCDKKCTTPHF